MHRQFYRQLCTHIMPTSHLHRIDISARKYLPVVNIASAFHPQDVGSQEHVVEAPLRFASAEECVRWRREASGTMQQMLSGLDDDAKQAIWNEVTDAMRQYETADGFESPCELLICSAQK
jgi:hypothetical protein